MAAWASGGHRVRILICGDRWWGRVHPNAPAAAAILARKQWIILHDYVHNLPNGTIVIQGGAPGADLSAGSVAAGRHLPVEEYPADWRRYGRAAGPIRNQQMLNEGKPHKVVAFHDHIEQSKGTADMLRRARDAGIPTEVITSE